MCEEREMGGRMAEVGSDGCEVWMIWMVEGGRSESWPIGRRYMGLVICM